ncbi:MULTISPECIES: hypothetical protein [unclassified Moorena]|nr:MULTISPECIES: hypothetical protein [unclassified Moorena]
MHQIKLATPLPNFIMHSPPDSRLPTPDSRFPIPDSLLPISF